MTENLTGPSFFLVLGKAGATSRLHAEREDGRMAGACTVRSGQRVAVLDVQAMAVRLNDAYLDGRPVCESCRAAVNIAACA